MAASTNTILARAVADCLPIGELGYRSLESCVVGDLGHGRGRGRHGTLLAQDGVAELPHARQRGLLEHPQPLQDPPPAALVGDQGAVGLLACLVITDAEIQYVPGHAEVGGGAFLILFVYRLFNRR